MRFRWIAAITLWTILSGPIFAPVGRTPNTLRERSLAATTKPSPKARPIQPAVFEAP
jgi:hypothetical protein